MGAFLENCLCSWLCLHVDLSWGKTLTHFAPECLHASEVY